jgi:hypothetical protein
MPSTVTGLTETLQCASAPRFSLHFPAGRTAPTSLLLFWLLSHNPKTTGPSQATRITTADNHLL